ncbi:helix-turn-helix domain-containing protein [Pedobacter nanyangensis]|uniref:helix-turn-helix domain-containing protein n=1 Tax=Pedobacter nanyangensis TaxID=1562389 RepID=UPI000DE36859|nr:AraC family transcriptional regulator [Pedobacter nanyangensis]
MVLYESDRTRLEELKSFIDEHIHEKLVIAALAERYGMSTRTLQRQFLAMYREPVFNYIHRKRMQTAMNIITSRTMRISQTAYAVGYRSLPSFVKAFTKYYGHPPTYYAGFAND